MLQKTVNDFAKSKDVKNSPVLRFKIYQSVSRILLQQQDYKSLEKYLLKTFDEYIKSESPDLFAMSTHHRSLYDKLFGISNTEKMAYHTKLPLMAFHHQQEFIVLI